MCCQLIVKNSAASLDFLAGRCGASSLTSSSPDSPDSGLAGAAHSPEAVPLGMLLGCLGNLDPPLPLLPAVAVFPPTSSDCNTPSEGGEVTTPTPIPIPLPPDVPMTCFFPSPVRAPSVSAVPPLPPVARRNLRSRFRTYVAMSLASI